VEVAAAVQRLLLVVGDGAGCRRRRAQKSPRRRGHVGREYERAEAAKLKQQRKADVVEAELPQPVVGVFRS